MEENTNVEITENQDKVTMSKDEYAKAIQSAEDKLRTNYSKQIKEMQAKIDELTPKEKSDSEIDFENRLKTLEAKEKKIALQESLQSKNIDKSIADFLRDDVDIEGFNTVIENLVSDRVKAAGYKPTGHSSNESISKDKWATMSYHEKQEFYNSNPELAKRFMGK